MASPNKQQKRAHRAKAKAKQNRTQPRRREQAGCILPAMTAASILSRWI
jgi:hypothetical protein